MVRGRGKSLDFSQLSTLNSQLPLLPKALITGLTGQDGSYLAELLLGKGYEVHGLVRSRERFKASPIGHLADRIHLQVGDLGGPDLGEWVRSVQPDELYHLAAQTHVAASVQDPIATLDHNVLGTARLLNACRSCPHPPRFFHASTSLVFGQPAAAPQDESTPFRPVNPYGAAKACATDLVRIARDTQGLFAVNGICYNHESPRRGSEFVTAKICRAAAEFKGGRKEKLKLGDISARRDWGDAREFVQGFWQSLQAPKPGDYVFATGQLHTVQDILRIAFESVGLEWRDHVETDATLLRSADPTDLVGNPSKARRELGWEAKKPFEELIREMTRGS